MQMKRLENCTPTNPASRTAIQDGPKKGIPSINWGKSTVSVSLSIR